MCRYMDLYFRPFESQKNGEVVGNIRDMVFNVEYLRTSFQSSKTIEEAMYSFWNKVSADYGNYWRFSIIEDDNIVGRIKVVDLNHSGEFNDDDILNGKISTPQETDSRISSGLPIPMEYLGLFKGNISQTSFVIS